MKELYDNYYEENLSQNKSQQLTENAFNKALRKYKWNYDRFFLPLPKDTVILDIGCGIGQFLYYLKERGYVNIQGIDLSNKQVELAKTMLPDINISCVANTAEFLNGRPNHYSVIVMNDMLEHVKPNLLPSLMAAVYRALRKDGVLIIKTINAAYPLSNAGRYMDLTHTTSFHEKSLTQLLRHSGFLDIQCYQEEIGIYNILFFFKKFIVFFVRLFIKLLIYFTESDWPRIISVNLIVYAKK